MIQGGKARKFKLFTLQWVARMMTVILCAVLQTDIFTSLHNEMSSKKRLFSYVKLSLKFPDLNENLNG
jgi:hypothetical protein